MALAFVQNKSGGQTNSASSTTSFLSTTAAGNLLIAAISMNSTADPVTSVTGGGTWSQAFGVAFTGGSLELWYCPNCSAITDVTVNYTGGAGGEATVLLFEFSGAATASPLDKTVTNSGTSANPDTGTTAATTQNDELIFSANGADGSSTSDFGTGYSDGKTDAFNVFSAGASDKIVSATGTYTNTFTLNTSKNWGAGIATFKAASAATTSTSSSISTSSTSTSISPSSTSTSTSTSKSTSTSSTSKSTSTSSTSKSTSTSSTSTSKSTSTSSTSKSTSTSSSVSTSSTSSSTSISVSTSSTSSSTSTSNSTSTSVSTSSSTSTTTSAMALDIRPRGSIPRFR